MIPRAYGVTRVREQLIRIATSVEPGGPVHASGQDRQRTEVKMRSAVITRATVAAAVVWVAGGVAHAWADPIVYYNLSYITGSASIFQNGTVVLSEPYSSGQTLPTTGAWAINDGSAVNQLGASAAASGAFDISVSPNLFSGSGWSSSSAADALGGITAEAWNQTFFAVLFRLTEPMTYGYTARLAGDGHMASSLWPLDPVSGLPSAAALFYESFENGDRTLAFSGLLMPGSYAFSVAALTRANASPLPQSSTAAFESANFALSPAAPIPEPATLLLVGAGLAAREALRRRGRRTA